VQAADFTSSKRRQNGKQRGNRNWAGKQICRQLLDEAELYFFIDKGKGKNRQVA
jgi:hypothetical protein